MIDKGELILDCIKLRKGTSLVRIFHAAPQAPKVDVYVNDMLAAENLEFTKLTDYMFVPVGDYTVTVYGAGDKTTPVIEAMLSVPGEKILTVAAVGNMDDLKVVVIDDETDKGPVEDESTVRVAHLAPNAPAVNVMANGMTLAEELSYMEITDYVNVTPETYQIDVTASSNDMSVLSFDLPLQADTVGTAYVLGDLPDLKPVYVVDGSTYICNDQK